MGQFQIIQNHLPVERSITYRLLYTLAREMHYMKFDSKEAKYGKMWGCRKSLRNRIVGLGHLYMYHVWYRSHSLSNDVIQMYPSPLFFLYSLEVATYSFPPPAWRQLTQNAFGVQRLSRLQTEAKRGRWESVRFARGRKVVARPISFFRVTRISFTRQITSRLDSVMDEKSFAATRRLRRCC